MNCDCGNVLSRGYVTEEIADGVKLRVRVQHCDQCGSKRRAAVQGKAGKPTCAAYLSVGYHKVPALEQVMDEVRSTR